jgi:dynein intermediate chain
MDLNTDGSGRGLGLTPESTTVGLQIISTAPVTVVYDAPPSPVQEVVTYSKEVQTTETWIGTDEQDELSSGNDEELREQIRKELEEELKQLHIEGDGDQTLNSDEKSDTFVRELSEDEKIAITASDEFLDFIDRSSKVAERALDMEYDVLADYGVGINGMDDDESGRRLKETAQFYDERWSKKRMVSDINFSPKVGSSPGSNGEVTKPHSFPS